MRIRISKTREQSKRVLGLAVALGLSIAPAQAPAGPWLLLLLGKGAAVGGTAKGGVIVGGAAKGTAVAGASKGTIATGASKGGVLASRGSTTVGQTAATATMQPGLIKAAFASKTFKYGTMVVAGALLYDAVTSAGYAMPADEFSQNAVIKDMLREKAGGEPSYRPMQCVDPSGELVIVPRTYEVCPWSSGGHQFQPGSEVIDLSSF